MQKQLLIFICLLAFASLSFGQKPPTNDAEFEKAYKRRISKEFLYGVYIPKDIGDAFVQLNRLADKESIKTFKTADERIAAKRLHFGLGRWIIHNWGFYGGSRFSVYLNRIGLHHPDDMAQFVIITYHRNLNRNPLDVKNLVVEIYEARKKMEEDKKEKGKKTILHEETRKRQ